MAFKSIFGFVKNLKRLDIFAQPVMFLTCSGDFKDRNKNKEKIYKYGSLTGFMFTFVILCVALSYLYVSFKSMMDATNDSYSN